MKLGFKALKGATITDIRENAVNDVTIVCGDFFYSIEADVINNIPMLSCKKYPVVKYAIPRTGPLIAVRPTKKRITKKE